VSTVVRIFVSIAFLLFFAGGVYSLVSGRSGALGALLVAGLIFPLMVEVAFPGRYALKGPRDGSSDHRMNRVRQFRTDHPGWGGTFLLVLLWLPGVLAIAALAWRLLAPASGR
jgi:hypothetical protein